MLINEYYLQDLDKNMCPLCGKLYEQGKRCPDWNYHLLSSDGYWPQKSKWRKIAEERIRLRNERD